MNNFSSFFFTFSQCFLLAALWLLFSCSFLLLLSPPFGPLPLASVRPQIAQSTWNVNAVWFDFHSRVLYCTIAPTNTELYSTIYGCIYIAVSRSSILDSRYSISRAFSAAVRSVCGWVKVLSFTHELLDAACAARPWIFHESLLEIFRPRLRCRLPLPLLRLCRCLCLCAQRWESNCCGFLRWRWGCVCSPVSDWGWVCGMRSWGSRSWRRFAELKNATSNGSSCVLLYLPLLLRGWLGISSSHHLKGGLRWGLLVCWTRSLRDSSLSCCFASRFDICFCCLSLSPTLSGSLALSAGACGVNFCRQMATLVRCWLVSWLIGNSMCGNSTECYILSGNSALAVNRLRFPRHEPKSVLSDSSTTSSTLLDSFVHGSVECVADSNDSGTGFDSRNGLVKCFYFFI